MKNGITTLAASNNAMWCDAVCRAHGRPGGFDDGLWLTRLGTPRFYPDVVTTVGAEAAPAQLKAIADLINSDRQREWFVKDSFHCLRLDLIGFEPLFDAKWIAMSGPRPDATHHRPGTVVSDDAGLSAWERCWTGEDGKAPAKPLPRVFMPRLLADDGIVFVLIRDEDGSAGGGILNRGAGVVGLSNLFGSQMDRVWQTLIAMAGELFPGLPLVGYEHGDDLTAAISAGFEITGPLRIWRLPAGAR
ncbi:hypothetical protein SSBR45G_40900 [Bradyrhizobium sp. SSBR45G]|uniref:hypothetical protein n=1 Tax=unclassified Bradyrhizobium TaxID=2631580 RepID=UPI002342A81A|nr:MULTISPECIES: hypothetical protein [unclassified Bradyrhizobium]GLH79181.1 hypothetical protein SSBR45G_40900 [Bradyrhizobium sp. SSBR45G]GLH84616.1 hypothetical protein SSBR45R_20760 [Bradyrhizobium sp. SSBR45R]